MVFDVKQRNFSFAQEKVILVLEDRIKTITTYSNNFCYFLKKKKIACY